MCQVLWLFRKWGTAAVRRQVPPQADALTRSHSVPMTTGCLSIHLFLHPFIIHSFALQIFMEHLLCATPCPRCWSCGIEQVRPNVCLREAYNPVRRWETTNKHKHINHVRGYKEKSSRQGARGWSLCHPPTVRSQRGSPPRHQSDPEALRFPCWNTARWGQQLCPWITIKYPSNKASAHGGRLEKSL